MALVKAVLNGSEYCFDGDSGCLRGILHPIAGQMLDPDSSSAGLIDLAFPVQKFEILRVGSKYTKGAKVVVSKNSVTVSYDRLGQNYENHAVQGAVKAVVTLKEAPDGVSVIIAARIENASGNDVRQILFPDIDGIIPAEGIDGTYHTCNGFRSKPFVELREPEFGEKDFYALKPSITGVTYRSGGYITKHTVNGIWREMIGHWFDIGGYKGGFSVHRRWWGWGSDNKENKSKYYWHKLDQLSGLLRIAAMHDNTINPGEAWESDDYWITPHRGGWAEGIKPYADWVEKNFTRAVPLPKHIKEGLGCRTLWMTQQYPDEPSSTVWKFSDLPGIAKESIEHGIDEIILWNTCDWGLPFSNSKVYELLGGAEAYADAIRECKKIGVNISHFVSYMTVYGDNNKRFGFKPRGPESSWTYHTQLVPVFRPNYGATMASSWADQNNGLWQQDVAESFETLMKLGVTSFGWDQFAFEHGKENGLPRLTEQCRMAASAIDPDATFHGESMHEIEMESRYLDYTWDWLYYTGDVDRRGFVNSFPSPRLNMHIESDPMDVKHSFMDNLYICMFPSKPGGINGSAYFFEYPQVCAALKQCTALRKQFLSYFTDGRIIGDCVLTSACKGARVTAYLREDSLLIIALRDTDEGFKHRTITFDIDASLWLGTGVYKRMTLNNEGVPVSEAESQSVFTFSSEMEYGEMIFIELIR